MYMLVVVVLKSILMFCVFANRLLAWFGPVDPQAMLSEYQNLTEEGRASIQSFWRGV